MVEVAAKRAVEGKRKRATKRAMVERNRRLIEYLMVGRTLDDIAAREGLSVRRTREIVRASLARRPLDTPAEFVQLQIRRLSEAMLVAYGAMSGGNLKAVDRVIAIVREFDRYHRFALGLPAPVELPAMAASPRPPALESPRTHDTPIDELPDDRQWLEEKLALVAERRGE
jgi:hypothetical protein